MLMRLLSKPGEVLSQEELYASMLGSCGESLEAIVKIFIFRIRQKISPIR